MEEDGVTHATIVPPLFLFFCLLYLVIRHRRQPKLHHIPTIGHSALPLSWIGTVDFLFNAEKLLQKGYEKYRTSAFRFAQFSQWTVVITSSQFIEEIRKATEEDLPYNDVAFENYAGMSRKHDELASLCIQHTRSLSLIFSDMRNETIIAFSDAISKGPTVVPAANTMVEIVSRVYNRGTVGLQGCRNPRLFAPNQSLLLFKASVVLALSRPLQFLILTLNRLRDVNRVHGLIVSLIGERQRGGQSPKQGVSHDLLSFLSARSNSSREMTRSIVALNYHAVLPTALTVVHALYHLASASHQEVVDPMREEVEMVTRKYGWTLQTLEYLPKIDSFLRESMRVNALSALTAHRKARKSYTFSDGTHMPAGTLLSLAVTPTHADPARYASPEKFDAFRFVHGDGPRSELAAMTPDFLAWGYGRTACPGRFVAVAMMKLIFAHIVLNYDVSFKDGVTERPKDKWVGAERLPDVETELLFTSRG